MSQEVKKSILPFITLPPDHQGSFDRDLERAAIFCLAEQKRDKGGGLLLKHPQEEVEFIAPVCYPFWWINIQESGFLFDGLLTTPQTLTYSKFPDVQSFIDNLESCKTREEYSQFLSDHLNYFKVLGVEKNEEVDGLVKDRVFLDEFAHYLTEAQPEEEVPRDMVTVTPRLERGSLDALIEKIKGLKSELNEKVDLLYTSMKLVKAKSQEFIEAICDEMESVEEECEERMEEVEASISEKVEEIREEYNRRMAEHSQKKEEDLMELQQAKIKLEKKKKRLTEEINGCETESKSCAVDQDEIGKNRWKDKANKLREELSECEEKLEEIPGKIEEVKEESKHRIFDLKSERDTRIKEIKEDKMEVECSKEAKMELYREKIEKLEEITPKIIEKMDELAKRREKAMEEFEKLGIQQKPEEGKLVYMPFYLVCYKGEPGRRYVYFPPSIVKNVSFSVKFKGALSKARINHLLQPRTEKAETFLADFLLLMEDNPVFNREINEACNKVNLLQREETQESIKTGLKKLKSKDWLTEKEYVASDQALDALTSEPQ